MKQNESVVYLRQWDKRSLLISLCFQWFLAQGTPQEDSACYVKKRNYCLPSQPDVEQCWGQWGKAVKDGQSFILGICHQTFHLTHLLGVTQEGEYLRERWKMEVPCVLLFPMLPYQPLWTLHWFSHGYSKELTVLRQ